MDLIAGANHTIIVTAKGHQTKIMAFGNEIGIGVDGIKHTHIPTEVTIKQLPNNHDLEIVYAKYNTSVAIDKSGRVFMWGEDSFNMRLRKPKIFTTFDKTGVRSIALGKRHGLVLDKIGQVWGWGDGTYGELGITENLPIE